MCNVFYTFQGTHLADLFNLINQSLLLRADKALPEIIWPRPPGVGHGLKRGCCGFISLGMNGHNWEDLLPPG